MRRPTSVHPIRFVLAIWVLLGLIAAMTHGHARHDAHVDHAKRGHATTVFPGAQPSDDTPTTSSDDAHEEHSSTPMLAAEVCLGCRSRHDTDDALHDAYPAPAAASLRHGSIAWSTPARGSARASAHAARAPPFARA